VAAKISYISQVASGLSWGFYRHTAAVEKHTHTHTDKAGESAIKNYKYCVYALEPQHVAVASATLSFAESKRPISGIHMYIYVYIHGKHTQLQLYWCHLLDA